MAQSGSRSGTACGAGTASTSASKRPASQPCSTERNCQRSAARLAASTLTPVRRSSAPASRRAGALMRGTPTKRARSEPGSLVEAPSKTLSRGDHRAAAPASCQRATSARNWGLRAVKYCAPWSHCQPSPRRVLIRPEGPRPLSKTAGSRPASRRAVAQDRPAMPAPITAMRGVLCMPVRVLDKRSPPALQPAARILSSRHGSTKLRRECSASISTYSMRVTGGSGATTRVTMKCSSLLRGSPQSIC